MSKKKIGILVISVVMIVSAFVWYQVSTADKLTLNLKESTILVKDGNKLFNKNGDIIFQTNRENEIIEEGMALDNKYFYTKEFTEKKEIHRVYRIDDLTKVFEMEEDKKETIVFLDIIVDDKLVFLKDAKEEYSTKELVMEGLKGNEGKAEIAYLVDGYHMPLKGEAYTVDLNTEEVEKIKKEDGKDIISLGLYQNSNKDIDTFTLHIGYMYDEERDEKFLITVVYDIEGREQFRYYALVNSGKTKVARMDTEKYFRQYNNLAYKDGLFGYINADGTMGIEYQYQNAGAFTNGYAKVEKVGGERVMIDMEGNESPAYIEGNEIDVKLANEGSIAYNKDKSEYYYYNSANELLVSDRSLRIDRYSQEGETFLINREYENKLIEGEIGIYTLDGTDIWPKIRKSIYNEMRVGVYAKKYDVYENQYILVTYGDEERDEQRVYNSFGIYIRTVKNIHGVCLPSSNFIK